MPNYNNTNIPFNKENSQYIREGEIIYKSVIYYVVIPFCLLTIIVCLKYLNKKCKEPERRIFPEPNGLTNRIHKMIRIPNSIIMKNKNSRECIICLETYEFNNEIIKLDCQHEFHKNCLFRWVIEITDNEEVILKKCPVCRKNIIIEI